MGVKQSATTKKKMGRKPKFDYTSDDFIKRISDLAKKGYTDREIARSIGLNETTFYEKKGEFSEISTALQCARDNVNAMVRAAFLRTAMGGKPVRQIKYIESKCECKGEDPHCKKCKGTGWYVSSTERQVIETEMAPNYTAQQRWLMNYDMDFRNRCMGTDDESKENNTVEGFDIEVTFNKKEDLELQEKVTKLKE